MKPSSNFTSLDLNYLEKYLVLVLSVILFQWVTPSPLLQFKIYVVNSILRSWRSVSTRKYAIIIIVYEIY
jgi:hypothetical protein